MASSNYQTFQQIYQAAIRDCKATSDSISLAQFKRWINEGQENIINRKKRDFLNKTYHVSLEAASSGTISIINGSTQVLWQNDADALLTSSAQEHKFKVKDFPEVYDVISFNSTAITLATTYKGTTATAASGVFFQSSQILDGDIRSIHKAYHDYFNVPTDVKGAEDFRAIVQTDPARLDYAIYTGLFGLDLAAGGDQRRLTFYPYPQKAYTLHIDANIYITPLVNDLDEPLLPLQHRQMLYWYAKAQYFAFHDETLYQVAMQNFNEWLAKLDGEFFAEREFPVIKNNNDRWQNRTSHRFRKWSRGWLR